MSSHCRSSHSQILPYILDSPGGKQVHWPHSHFPVRISTPSVACNNQSCIGSLRKWQINIKIVLKYKCNIFKRRNYRKTATSRLLPLLGIKGATLKRSGWLPIWPISPTGSGLQGLPYHELPGLEDAQD